LIALTSAPGIDINCQDEDGETLLHRIIAIRQDQRFEKQGSLVNILLHAQGIDQTFRTNVVEHHSTLL
jgi:hypothetical protein